MVITYGRVWMNRVRLLILFVVSWTGELNFSLSPFAPVNLVLETGSDVAPSRVSLLILHTQAEFGAYSRDPCRFPRRRPSMSSTATGSVPSLSGHTVAYRRRSLLRARRRRASSPQRSSSNGCCLFRFKHEPIFVRLLFPHPTLIQYMCVCVCIY